MQPKIQVPSLKDRDERKYLQADALEMIQMSSKEVLQLLLLCLKGY